MRKLIDIEVTEKECREYIKFVEDSILKVKEIIEEKN